MDPLYAEFDLDDPDLARLSLCIDCAKHPRLKRFVAEHPAVGPVCGICNFVDARYVVCDLGVRKNLEKLVRGLVRFELNEAEFNTHWGADHQLTVLMASENPLFEHEPSNGRKRSPDQSEPFLLDIFDNAYPNPAEGISLYAGFDEDGGRHMNFAIKDNDSFSLRALKRRLLTENYFSIEPNVDELVDSLGARIVSHIQLGARFWRARIGAAATYQRIGGDWRPDVLYRPFAAGDLGAPPPPKATAGRLNRVGVSFLYLASDIETAAAEVRPHPSHHLSIGQFEASEQLMIASFDVDIAKFVDSEFDLDLFHFVHSMDRAMALPVVPGEGHRYSVTQLVADCLRRRGFDGVSFQSSISCGTNLCVFRPEAFSYLVGSGEVHYVKALEYDLVKAPTLLNPTDDDVPMGGFRW